MRSTLIRLFCAVVAASTFLAADSSLAQQEAEESAGSDATVCRMDIEGDFIEKLTFESRSGEPVEIEHPGSSLSLPPGQYLLSKIELEGGYVSYPRHPLQRNRFSLTPDKPCELKVGAPLTPKVKATRWGTLLRLNYELLDDAGRQYFSSRRGNGSPQFAVYMGDRKVGSGSFEYG